MTKKLLGWLLAIEIAMLFGVLFLAPLAMTYAPGRAPTTVGPFGPLATWALTALPTLIVIQHAVVLWLAKGRSLTDGFRHDGQWKFSPVADQARNEFANHFSPATITLRYAAPALLLFAVAHADARGLFGSVQCDWSAWACGTWHADTVSETLRGARYGAVGAYTYVVLTLGQRTFRRDVTTGITVWCVVTLATGPIVAAVLARVWNLGAGPSSGWERSAAFFVAGMTPRHVTAWLTTTAEQLWMGRKENASNPSRATSIMSVRGVDAQEAERLAEEGIFDAATLALANPYRLLRNTPYDLRQLVGWMDEASLMIALPKDWEALENAGISGAIDLAWFHYRPARELTEFLAEAQLTQKEATIRRVADRLAEDAQVQLLWTLWQSGIEARDADADQTTQ